MALSEKQLQAVNSLDFKTIKEDLVNYLSGQEKFQDYDFEGSGMSILLDILAYNTHHMGFYANMLANESFLDSSLLRGSSVSIAKSLGYNPRSRRGAEIIVDVRLSDPNNEISDLITRVNSKQFRIVGNEVFRSSFGGENYFFYAVETVYFEYEGQDGNGNPLIYARNVKLREGRLKTKTFIVNNQFGNDQRFIIPDENLDDRSVRVFVRKSQTESEGSTDIWTRSTNIIDNTSTSKVFFLQEVYDGKFEVYFGDGVVGQPLQQGNVVLVSYASCSGPEANNIGRSDSATNEVFSYIPSSAQNSDVSSAVLYSTRILQDDRGNPIASYGGQEKETQVSMKFYAPRSYETQDRAVTLNDYITLLQKNYSGSIKSIHAWGGEDSVPPEYGKVFIAVRPRVGLFLNTQEKVLIEKSILDEKNVVSITPTVVDADYLYISPSLTLKYDVRTGQRTIQSLENLVITYVKNFGLRNLAAFEKNFYSGSLIRNILEIDNNIKSCTVDIEMNKILYPIFNRSYSYRINFQNALSPLSRTEYIQSSIFRTYGNSPNASNLPAINAYFKDNGSGKISLYNNDNQSLIVDNYGSVDYTTGLVTLYSAEFLLNSDLSTYEVKIFTKPRNEDVLSARETILEMNQENIQVLVETVSTVRM